MTINDEKQNSIFGGAGHRDYALKFDRRNLEHSGLLAMAGRAVESLNGSWHFSIDPYDMGLRSDWQIQDRTDAAGRQLPWDYDADGGESIQVPACWNLARPEYLYYEGSAWYAREFAYATRSADERVFLRVGAANYHAIVFLNQEYLGNHYGGSTPFFVELTGRLREKNLLQVCVNNARDYERVPMANTDWFNYGGLYRDVELVRVPKDFIRDFRIHLVPNGRFDEIALSVAVSDAAAQDQVRVRIDELGVDTSLKLEHGQARGSLNARPVLWSPDEPRLYDVRVDYRDDSLSERIGFRQIEARGTGLLLNGEPLFLRGICVHEDDITLGKASNEADIRRRFAHARELGCNFLRLAHYPHHELAARLADEAGLLLWEEIPVYWAIDFDNPRTYQDAQNQLLELIGRDYNRASVIIWSVGNENADTDERLKFMSALAGAAREADPARLVSAACLINHERRRIEDRLMAALDVVGINEYYGWYSPDYQELIEVGRNSSPGKPVIISETGADALAGRHAGRQALFSEEHMEDLYRRQIEILREMDFVQGISPWILYDFRSPRRQNRFQQGYNRKGLIAADKSTKKKAFFVLQAFYAEKKEESRKK